MGSQKEYVKTTDHKYRGKASQITIEDIPEEYRDDRKIQAFVTAFSSYQQERKTLILKIQEEMFALLTDCNVIGLVNIYEKHSGLFGLTEFYDKLLKPVMYRIGDLWQQGQPDVATEHAGTNTAISLIKIINERMSTKTTVAEFILSCCSSNFIEFKNVPCFVILYNDDGKIDFSIYYKLRSIIYVSNHYYQ